MIITDFAGILKPDFRIAFELKGAPRTQDFIGRDKELESMSQHLAPNAEPNRRKICVIHGLGGIGKTQLAIKYATTYEHLYTSVFWLEGKTENSLLRSLVTIASRLPKDQVSIRDIKDTTSAEELKEIGQKVLRWFTLEGNHNWLLIFDNIDKTSTLASPSDSESLTTYDIKSYFPAGDRGSIVITTRLQRLQRLEFAKLIQLQKLNPTLSLKILENTSGKAMRLPENSDQSSKDSEVENCDSGKLISRSITLGWTIMSPP